MRLFSEARKYSKLDSLLNLGGMFPDSPQSLTSKNSRFFSVDGSAHRGRGFWAKITNWNVENSNPDPNSIRRGRITENFMVAPFFEHVATNEGGY